MSRLLRRPLWQAMARRVEPAGVEFVCVAISHAWLITLLAWHLEPVGRRNLALTTWGLPLSLTWASLAAAGLACSGVAMRAAFPAPAERLPAPSHATPAHHPHLWAGHALSVIVAAAVLSLLLAVAAAVGLGQFSAMLALAAAAALLLERLAGAYLPVVGVLGAAAVHGLIMLMPNPHLGFAWPLVLVISHVTLCAVLAHVWSGRRPKLSGLDGSVICGGWVFMALLLVGWMSSRQALAPDGLEGAVRWLWLGPAAAALGFVLASGWMLRQMAARRLPPRAIAERFSRLAGLWLILYNASWLLAAGLIGWGVAMLGLFVLAGALGQAIERLRFLLRYPNLAYRLHPVRPLR